MMSKLHYISAIVAALCLFSTGAHATLVDEGITYNLYESTTGNPLTDQFTLNISGINGPSDTQGGRYGVDSFAFNKPSNYASATAPSGFTTIDGGLNSSGCNSSGNFYCFSANTKPTGPALAANSTLSYIFSVTLTSGDFSNYKPDFKINWLGTKNNYDLVSKELDPTPMTSVPEPGSLLIFGIGLLILGFTLRHRYRLRP